MLIRLSVLAMAASVIGSGMARGAEAQRGPSPVEIKVEVMNANGETLAEVHGSVHDLELLPGTTVAWYFYPMTNGENLALLCHKEGHREGGMVGSISISGPPPFQPPSGK